MSKPGASFDAIVPISELQKRSRALVEQVRKTGAPIVVTQRGRPAAMLVNYDLYEGHLATLDETSFPDWEEKLARAEREVTGSRLLSQEQVTRRRTRRAKR